MLRGLVSAGERGSEVVAIWAAIWDASWDDGCDSSISANFDSGAAAARAALSRPKRLRKLVLEDWRLTGLWRGTGPSEPLVLGYSDGRGRCNRGCCCCCACSCAAVGRLKLVWRGASGCPLRSPMDGWDSGGDVISKDTHATMTQKRRWGMKRARIIGANVGLHVGPTSLAAGDWPLTDSFQDSVLIFERKRKKRVQEEMDGSGGDRIY